MSPTSRAQGMLHGCFPGRSVSVLLLFFKGDWSFLDKTNKRFTQTKGQEKISTQPSNGRWNVATIRKDFAPET